MGKWAHSTLVDGVDESDEPPGQIAFAVRHGRHARHDKGFVTAHQLEIVGRAGGLADQLVKGKHGGLAARLGYVHVAAPHLMGRLVRGVAVRVAQEAEPLLGVRDGGFVDGVVVDARGRAGELAVVGGGVEVYYLEARFEQVDAGDEGGALDAVFVQVVGVPVGGRDEDDAVGH